MSRLFVLASLSTLALTAACGGDDSSVPSDTGGTGGEQAANAGTGGATGGSTATGGSSATGGTFTTGPTGVAEIDPDESCVEDPEADSWHSSDFPEVHTTYTAAFGGDLLLVTVHDSDGFEYRLGRITDGEITWQTFQPPDRMMDLHSIAVAPDGSAAYALAGYWLYPHLYYSTGGDFTDYGTVPLSVSHSGSTLTPLSDGRLIITRPSIDGFMLEQFDIDNGFTDSATQPNTFKVAARSGEDTLAVYADPSIVADPDLRVEYTWDVGFGTAEELPDNVALTSGWTIGFDEFENGVGFRAIQLNATTDSDGLYFHVRSGDAWSSQTKLLDVTSSYYYDAFDYVGEGLFFTETWSSDRATVYTFEDGAWDAGQDLPRSREADFSDAVGSLDGTALIAAAQIFSAQDIETLKLFRRGETGQWYCPRLLRYSYSETFSDGEGTFVVIQSGYDQPLHFEVFDAGE